MANASNPKTTNRYSRVAIFQYDKKENTAGIDFVARMFGLIFSLTNHVMMIAIAPGMITIKKVLELLLQNKFHPLINY